MRNKALSLASSMAICAAAHATDGPMVAAIAPVAEGGGIYSVNPITGEVTFVVDTAPIPASNGTPNGLAIDRQTRRAFYNTFLAPSNLYVTDLLSGEHVLAGTLEGSVACGSVFQGAYYYIPSQAGTLRRVTVGEDGIIESDVQLDLVNPRPWGFGDIAISPEGILFGSGGTDSGQDIFRIDLAEFTGQVDYLVDQSTLPGLQLGFDEGCLIGLNIGTRQFFEIDQATGSRTEIGGLAPEAPLFTDLAARIPALGIPGDVDGDGEVGFADLTEVLANWGPCSGCHADLNGDGDVGFEDLTEVLAAWSP